MLNQTLFAVATALLLNSCSTPSLQAPGESAEVIDAKNPAGESNARNQDELKVDPKPEATEKASTTPAKKGKQTIKKQPAKKAPVKNN